MHARLFIPMIDLAFLSLGAIVAILSQTELIRALAVDVTEVERGVTVISRDEVSVITITDEGLYVDGERVDMARLAGAVDHPLAVLRADRRVPVEIMVKVMGILAAKDVELRIEVDERPEAEP